MDTVSPRVLIVEDDPRLAKLMAELLTRDGYNTSIEPRGDASVGRVLVEKPDLVLLDIELPGLDGLRVCHQVRTYGYRGTIIMITARGEPIDEVTGLEIGADDYIAKPMNPKVLLARVRARLRRASLAPDAQTLPKPDTLGALSIDRGRREVRVEGRVVALSTAEYDLLVYLADRIGTVVEREQIYRDLRGMEYDGIDRSIDLRIAKLRRLLQDDPNQPRWIKTVRGVGYMMMASR